MIADTAPGRVVAVDYVSAATGPQKQTFAAGAVGRTVSIPYASPATLTAPLRTFVEANRFWQPGRVVFVPYQVE